MLTPRFYLGQFVYAVSVHSKERRVPVDCYVCASTGKIRIVGRDGNYPCPSCNGRTRTEKCDLEYYIALYDAKIGKIEIEAYSKEYEGNYRSKVSYMLDKTGVGSGQVWREDRLFATEDEAVEFCNNYVPSDTYDMRSVLKAKPTISTKQPSNSSDQVLEDVELTREEFYEKHCKMCGSQSCEGIGTKWFSGCKFKDQLII